MGLSGQYGLKARSWSYILEHFLSRRIKTDDAQAKKSPPTKGHKENRNRTRRGQQTANFPYFLGVLPVAKDDIISADVASCARP